LGITLGEFISGIGSERGFSLELREGLEGRPFQFKEENLGNQGQEEKARKEVPPILCPWVGVGRIKEEGAKKEGG